MVDAVMYSSESEEHYTPKWLLRLVSKVLGGIDVDPCADPQHNVPARMHFTKEDNGLYLPWNGTVFMNPPYGMKTVMWVKKLDAEYQSGRTTGAITLTASRTDTEFYSLLPYPKVLVRGRMTFLDVDMQEHDSAAPFPVMLAYYGKEPDKFARTFQHLGDVIVPYPGIT